MFWTPESLNCRQQILLFCGEPRNTPHTRQQYLTVQAEFQFAHIDIYWLIPQYIVFAAIPHIRLLNIGDEDIQWRQNIFTDLQCPVLF